MAACLESLDEERCIPPYLSHWKIQNFSCCVQVETLSFATNFRGAEISIETKSFGTPEIMSLIMHIYYCKGVPVYYPGLVNFFWPLSLTPSAAIYSNIACGLSFLRHHMTKGTMSLALPSLQRTNMQSWFWVKTIQWNQIYNNFTKKCPWFDWFGLSGPN